MLIMLSNKFCNILIVGSIKSNKILSKLAKLKIIRGVDQRIESTQSQIEVEVGSFLTLLYLLKILG